MRRSATAHSTFFIRRSFLAITVSLALCAVGAARGDQVVVQGENHTGAKVLSLEDGRLQVRLADGRTQAFWLDQVDLLIVDRGGVFEDFNQGDRFLSAGDAEKAAVRFERALRLSGDFWPDVCAARLTAAYDRTGQLDKATLNFIRLARGRFAGPPAAARLMPQNIPGKRDAKFTRSIDHLDSALDQEPSDPTRVLFEILRYEILRRAADERAARVVEKIALASVPDSIRTEPVYAVLQHALGETLRGQLTPESWTALNRAIQDCPDASLPGFLLLKGETMLRTASTRDDFIRASWPFLHVAAHRPDDPRAADGLAGGAAALERTGRRGQAIALLEECLAHKRLTDETRHRAEESLTRLRSAKP